MRKTVLLLATVLTVAGCRDSLTSTGTVDADFVGSYALRTIAGFELPYSILRSQGFNLEVTADTVRLGLDGSYFGRTHYRRTDGSVVDFPSDSVRGTWSAIGRTIKVEAKGTSFTAVATSVDLTVDPNRIAFVYRKM